MRADPAGPPFHLPAGPASDHLAAIVENSDDAILSKDPTGRIMTWNPGATRMYGYTAQEAIGQPISILIPPHRAGEEMAILRSILAGERVEHYETERLTKGGRMITVSLSISPVRSNKGDILGASVIARDVTRQHQITRLTTLLQEVTAELSRAITPARVVEVTVAHAVDAFGADAVALGLLEEEEIVIAGSAGHSPERLERFARFSLDADLPMAESVRTGAPVWESASIAAAERYADLAERGLEFPGIVILPLLAGGAALGALSLSFRDPREFDAQERAFLLAASQQAAYALGRAQIYEVQRLDAERQAFLGEAGGLLAGSLDPQETLSGLTELSVRHVADFACAYLLDESGGLGLAAVTHSQPDRLAPARELAEYLGGSSGSTVVDRVVRSVRGELHGDARGRSWLDDDATGRELAGRLDAHSLVVVPMHARGRILGALAFGAAAQARRYEGTDLLLGEDLGQRAGLAVANAQLFRREHEAAVTLQRSLLPHSLPEIPGLSFAVRYEPAAPGLEVGGDWYEVVHVEDGTVGLTIGDVAGRGVRAASVMGRIRPALAAYVVDGHGPQEAVRRLDRLMHGLDDPVMATLFHLQYDVARASARYVRAGHPPALLRTPEGSVVELGGEGTPPIGILRDVAYVEHEVSVPPGSLLLLYTDGLIERREVDLGTGLDRLKRSLADAPRAPRDCLAWLSRALGSDDVPDDVAMLAVAT